MVPAGWYCGIPHSSGGVLGESMKISSVESGAHVVHSNSATVPAKGYFTDTSRYFRGAHVVYEPWVGDL